MTQIHATPQERYEYISNQHGGYWRHDFIDHNYLYNLYFPPEEFFSHITKMRHQLPQVKATIEPVAKLGEVPVKVFLTVYALSLTAIYGWGYNEQTSIK
jgi:hypothetical protein